MDDTAGLRREVEALTGTIARLQLEVLQLRREYVGTQLHLLRHERGDARLDEDTDAVVLIDVLASLRRRIERHV